MGELAVGVLRSVHRCLREGVEGVAAAEGKRRTLVRTVVGVDLP